MPFPDMQRPVFLSGKVMMEDGTPPPDSVVIERVCNGTPRPEAYTDSKGRFSFQLGQNTAMMQDASVSSASDPSFGGGNTGLGGRPQGQFGGPGGMGGGRGISERDLMGCELRASLAGFRSDMVNLSGRRAFDNPDVGTIILRRLGNVEGTTISATSLQAPKDAKKAYDKARSALKKNKLDEAQKELQKAVEIYPRYATAWFELGRVHEQGNDVGQAREAYSKALEADVKFVNPYLQMALIAAKENKWQDVADTTDRVLKLNPFDFPQAFFYNSVANYNLGKLDAAEKSARDAQKLDTQHRIPKVDHLLGMILAQKRDYNGAAEQMRSYLKFSPQAQDADTVRTQLAEIEKLSGVGKVETGKQ
jgi:tetratricopeptide (TPR) repeat protein